jgi:tetraacyldisaccharide 4'-kinase
LRFAKSIADLPARLPGLQSCSISIWIFRQVIPSFALQREEGGPAMSKKDKAQKAPKEEKKLQKLEEKNKKKKKKETDFRKLLRPLVPVYRLGLALRELLIKSGMEPTESLHWPVISIGNLSTGGTGKTPLAIALARELTRRGGFVNILSRGYGRSSHVPLRVKRDGTAEEFGDEPVLIARESGVPVYVAASRFEAGTIAERELEPERRAVRARFDREVAEQARQAELRASNDQLALASESQKGAYTGGTNGHSHSLTLTARSGQNSALRDLPPVHLLDDGFQHRQLARAVNILIINRQDWQDSLLPSGNLREPLDAAHRATVIAIPSKDPELELAIRQWGWQGPIWKLRRVMSVALVREPVAAFCGIGNPEQFFEGLKLANFKLVGEYAFPDHFTYTPAILKELVEEAREWGATALLTTQKDHVRMGKLTENFPGGMPLITVRLTTEIEDIESVLDFLEDTLNDAAKPGGLRR